MIMRAYIVAVINLIRCSRSAASRPIEVFIGKPSYCDGAIKTECAGGLLRKR
jgi:hypothetical protein